MVRHFFLLSLIFASVGSGASVLAESGIVSDEPTTEQLKTKGNRKKLFDGMIFTNSAGDSLPFVIMEPEQGRTKPLPLVICLHESATPRQSGKQIDGFALDLASQPSRKRMPCIIVAPVAPDEWTSTSHDAISGHEMPAKSGETSQLVIDLIDELVRTHKVDRKRIYIVGRDIGGSGALEIAARRPELIAGVVAFDPYAYQGAGKQIGKTPVKIVQDSGTSGDPEGPKKPGKSNGGAKSKSKGGDDVGDSAAAAELKSSGATRVSSAKADWSEQGRTALLDWLFRQKR